MKIGIFIAIVAVFLLGGLLFYSVGYTSIEPAANLPTKATMDDQDLELNEGVGSPPPVTNININNEVMGDIVVEKDRVVVQPQTSEVYINGHELTSTEMSEFASTYGSEPQPGNYWYDTLSGAFGYVGHPTYSVMYSGHNFGTLRADASSGDSGAYINGRHLPQDEAVLVAALFGSAPVPGNYSLDASGNFYSDGVFVANLYLLAVQSGESSGGGGGDNFWSSGVYSAGNYNAGNSQGYVSVPGVGPVGYGF